MHHIITELTAAYGFLIVIVLAALIPLSIGALFLFRDADFQKWKGSIDFKEVRENVTKNLMAAAMLGLLLLTSCTENERAKRWGGTATVDLPPGTKFVGATWKESALWYCTRPALAGEIPITVTLQEQSSFGLVEGKVLFVEK